MRFQGVVCEGFSSAAGGYFFYQRLLRRPVYRLGGKGLMIVTLFVTAQLEVQQGFLIGLLFVACMVSLFASLVAFICDINLSLHALKLELEGIVPVGSADKAKKSN
jgi:hypothetical protein